MLNPYSLHPHIELELVWCRINENDLFKHDWRSRSKVQVLQYIFLKWILAFLVGLLTGIIATLINLAVENIAGYKLLAAVSFIEKERFVAFLTTLSMLYSPTSIKISYYSLFNSLWQQKQCVGIMWCRYLMGFIYLAGANLLLTTVASVLCVCFAPTAAGPGIPEIKAYLNGVDTPNMFGATTMIVKVGWLFKIENVSR